MKTIPNTQTSLREGDKKLTHADLLKACLNQPPAQGFDLATMRARLRVAEAAEKAKPGKEIQLEDADHAVAVAAVRDMRWSGMHRDIVAFSEAVLG